MSEASRAARILASYRRLPLWVQWWVALLVLVNSLWVFCLDTVTGQAVAGAALFVVLSNGPLLWHFAGMNRALSIPHLFAWIPLEVFLLQHVLTVPDLAPPELAYAVAVLVVNGISLAFDVLDSWRWLRGERENP